jgi:hypothetical protein
MPFLLAERAHSEGARPMRAVGSQTGHPSVKKSKRAWREHIYRSMRAGKDSLATPLGVMGMRRMGWPRWLPVLAGLMVRLGVPVGGRVKGAHSGRSISPHP